MAEQAVWTVNRILQWTQQYFTGKGLENPRLDAEVLLCDVLGCRRIDLFMRLQQELLPEELKQYRSYVLRRAAWEPLAYIIGRKAFLQWEFKVTPAVLIPRPETELLVEKLMQCCTGKTLAQLEKEAFWRRKAEEARAAAEKVKEVSAEKLKEETDSETAAAWQQEVANREAVVEQAAERAGIRLAAGGQEMVSDAGLNPKEIAILDIGTGTGAILLSLLKLLPDSRGLAVDISPEALAVTKENAAILGVADRTWYLQSDVWSRMPAKAQFDILVSNPPYIPTEVIGTLAADVRKEPRQALDGGPDGLDLYRKITEGMSQHIKPDGLAAFEVGIGQGEAVASQCKAQGFTVTAVVKDYAGIDRMVFSTRPDSARAGWVKNLQKND
ncbi:MAG: peptide chain release factor N(5)-glutamine methyltransferase [Acidaminococcaceae bacterium]|nr:peptide chain release factor N(5)-glutamine methyltransferase [Acidaminococcaceae bacterium]